MAEVFTYSTCYDYIRLTLGADTRLIPMKEVVDQAGSYFTSMHTWAWKKNRSVLLDVRGQVSGTTARWTEATLTLTDTAAFASYTFVGRDQIEIQEGTGVTEGRYTIASKTSSNAIVLTQSISSAAVDLNTGDIQYLIETPTVTLPADFKAIFAIYSAVATDLRFGPRLVPWRTLLEHKTQFSPGTSYGTFAAITHVDADTPVLEIWPAPASALRGAYKMVYHAGWSRQSSDTADLDVPEWARPLFLEVLKAVARGHMDEDVATMDQRLAPIREGPLFYAARMHDGQFQRYYGFLQNGGTLVHGGMRRSYGRGSVFYGLGGTLSGPS